MEYSGKPYIMLHKNTNQGDFTGLKKSVMEEMYLEENASLNFS